MPLYEYKCDQCNEVTESIENWNTKEINCLVCNNIAHRIISLSNFELKGSGWYKDGYSNNTQKGNNEN